MTDKSSFTNVQLYLEELERFANPNLCKLIVGNKKDLDKRRKASFEDSLEFCETQGIPLIETSCKINESIEESFMMISYQVLSGIYELPIIPYFKNEIWSNKIHKKFPKSFRQSVFVFLVCLKAKGFRNEKRIQNYILFQIIRLLSFDLDFACFVQEISQMHYKLESKNETHSSLIFRSPSQKRKKDCYIF